MSEIRDLLDREARRIAPGPDPLGSIIHRVHRRRRVRRVGTVLIAMAIALAATGYLARVFEFAQEQPASITPVNVGDLEVAWKAGLGGLPTGLSLGLLAHHKASHFPTPVVFPPVVAGDQVYVASGSGSVSTFPLACGSSGATCRPTWVADTGSRISRQPTVWGGMVFVATDTGGLQAFRARCATQGETCTPAWIGSTGEPSSSPIVRNGLVYVQDLERGEVLAFRVDCADGGRSCQPLWRAEVGPPWPRRGPSPRPFPYTPVVADGVIYVVGSTMDVYALDASNGDLRWVGRTGWNSTRGPRFTEVAVADGEVYAEAGTTLFAFAEGCGTGGATCRPSWTGGTPDTLVMTKPVVSDGVVYIATASNGGTGHVEAFRAHCRSDGRVCHPLWVGRAESETTSLYPVVAGDRVYVTSAIRGSTDAFARSCSRACPISWHARPLPRFRHLGLSQPPLVADGLVFVDNGTEIRAFDAACPHRTCIPLWQWAVPSGIASSPVIAGDKLIVATSTGEIYTLTPGGTA